MGTKEKEAVQDFEYMLALAEAKAWSKISLERPLTKKEFAQYKTVCNKIGVRV